MTTDCETGSDPDTHLRKIQKEADLSCDWLKDNRVVVAGQKSKFLIIGTKEMRNKKCNERMYSICVDGKNVFETQSEKLLDVVINNTMTWRDFLYCETWLTDCSSKGLNGHLSQRLGMLKRLSKFASRKTLKMIAQGIFYSTSSAGAETSDGPHKGGLRRAGPNEFMFVNNLIQRDLSI